MSLRSQLSTIIITSVFLSMSLHTVAQAKGGPSSVGRAVATGGARANANPENPPRRAYVRGYGRAGMRQGQYTQDDQSLDPNRQVDPNSTSDTKVNY